MHGYFCTKRHAMIYPINRLSCLTSNGLLARFIIMADLYRWAQTFCVCHPSHLNVHFSQKSTIYHLNVSQDCPKYDGLVSKNRRIKCIHSSPSKNQINTEEYTMTFVCVSVCSMVFFFHSSSFLGETAAAKCSLSAAKERTCVT